MPRKVFPKHLLIKSIISHGSMMIVKLQSDHARQLYENSNYSQVLKTSIILKFIGQKLVIKISKKTSWRNYVNKHKSSSKSKKVWDMIRKISGKNTSSPFKHLSKNHIKATNKKDKADLLAKTFSKNSSSTKYSKPFQNIKKNAEKSKLNFKLNNLED